jgi:hypothetical protein
VKGLKDRIFFDVPQGSTAAGKSRIDFRQNFIGQQSQADHVVFA